MAAIAARTERALAGEPSPERLSTLRAAVSAWREVRGVDVGTGSAPDEHATRAIAAALAEVGVSDWGSWSLRAYDADRYGPLFGVSDDGRNAEAIAEAFVTSPKALVLRRRGELSISTIGGCLDAERMSAAGELLVGPHEYGQIYAAVAGRVPMSTNVGTVVLPRFYRPAPFAVYRPKADEDPYAALATDIKSVLEPYTASATRPARPVTAYVVFLVGDRVRSHRKIEVLKALAAALERGEIGDPEQHAIGLLQRSKQPNASAVRYAIDIVNAAGLHEVRVEAHSTYESQDQLLLPGLTALFDDVKVVDRTLAYAHAAGVTVQPKNSVDPETAARTIWAGLTAARSMGAHLGKFGLFPLTLEQQVEAASHVAEMISDWTAVPAFYADRPTVAADRVFSVDDAAGALDRWLKGIADAGFDLALLDAPDRTPRPAGTGGRSYHEDRGRRLIKRQPADRIGIFADAQVPGILARAKELSIRLLWAGGLSAQQVFDLARANAFGIFTTTAASRLVPVKGRGDPSLAARMQPTYNGVLGVKMVIEAGFLYGRAATASEAESMEDAAAPVVSALDAGTLATADDGPAVAAMTKLGGLLEQAWEHHFERASPAS